jgi:hypothetical protein
VFDGADERFAIKISRIALWQFLYDPGSAVIGFKNWSENAEESDSNMKIWLDGNREPWRLSVTSDYADFADDLESGSEIQELFDDFENCFSEDEWFHIADVDGESTFFRAEHAAMITVKLAAIKPELYEDAATFDAEA